MSHVWANIIIEMINIGGTLLAAIIMRWLLGLSTIEKDLTWIKQTNVYKFVDKIQFYRGKELMHQIRGKRVYSHSTD
jgi:hypothetical protein